jgi:hypothetical protein
MRSTLVISRRFPSSSFRPDRTNYQSRFALNKSGSITLRNTGIWLVRVEGSRDHRSNDREKKKAKQPYFMYPPGRPIFPFASPMCRWKVAEAEASIVTATIITRAAEGPAGAVHTRMPLILRRKLKRRGWIQSRRTSRARGANAAAVLAVDLYPVSSRVNNSRSADGASSQPAWHCVKNSLRRYSFQMTILCMR